MQGLVSIVPMRLVTQFEAEELSVGYEGVVGDLAHISRYGPDPRSHFRVLRPDNCSRPPVDHRVEHPARFLIRLVTRAKHGALHQPGQSFAQLPVRYGPVIRHLPRYAPVPILTRSVPSCLVRGDAMHERDHCVTAMTAGMSEEVRLVTRTAIPLARSATCWALRAR
jgi:hypothetical protein